MTSVPQRPQLALIGISGYGRVHLQLASECSERGEAQIVAATVINPADEVEAVTKLRSHGCRIFSDYQEMLREMRGRIDLCLIPTGIHWHARMTIAALEAGANVLVEKPLAGSSAEIRAIQEAERKSGRFVAVGFQDFYEPGTTWLKSELQRGVIGEIKSVRFLGLWPRDRTYFTRNDWAGRLIVQGAPVFDSPLNNAFAHFAMLSLFFAGADRKDAPLQLEGVEMLRAHAIESFDTCVVSSRTPGGARLWFGASHACRETIEPEIAIVGSEGEACWRYEDIAWWRRKDGTADRRKLLDAYGARRAMITAALHRLRDPAVPICTSEMAGQHTALIEAVHRAGPIRPWPDARVQWTAVNGSGMMIPEISGMADAMRRAFQHEEMLSGAGFSVPALAGPAEPAPADPQPRI